MKHRIQQAIVGDVKMPMPTKLHPLEPTLALIGAFKLGAVRTFCVSNEEAINPYGL